MKNTIIVSLFFFVISVNCIQASDNRAYFSINPNDRKILLPVELEDSVKGYFFFDTFHSFAVDSTFSSEHPSLSVHNNSNIKSTQGGSFFATSGINLQIHEINQTIKIGNTSQEYRNIQVYDLKGYMYNNELDGIFNIPQNDTINLWELNFDHNYLEIHPSEKFKMPQDCFLFPMAEDVPGDKYGEKNAIKIQIPMKIQCSDGDTLTLNKIFYIDTGMPWDIALMHQTEEVDFFNEKEDAVWTMYVGSYHRYHKVKATMLDNYVMDSVRIYTFDRPTGIGDKGLIGINFLKRFNVFFDMKNRQVGFQPVKKHERIVEPLARRYHYAVRPLANGNSKVSHIADYEANYYKKAGLQLGDEIVALDGKPYKDISKEERRELYTRDTIILDIIRNGEALKIIVPVNKTEIQGD